MIVWGVATFSNIAADNDKTLTFYFSNTFNSSVVGSTITGGSSYAVYYVTTVSTNSAKIGCHNNKSNNTLTTTPTIMFFGY